MYSYAGHVIFVQAQGKTSLIKLFNYCHSCSDITFNRCGICYSCIQKMDKAKFDSFMVRCKHCSYPLLSSIYKCPDCKDYDVFSIYDYSDSFARQRLFDYKFNNKKKLSRFFASEINKNINKDEIIVPIPSSDASIKRRGWDQMSEIAKHIDNERLCCLKNNSTVQQKLLNKQDRIKAAQNKFYLCTPVDDDLKNRKFVIIDDVYTTGSTVNDAVSVLRNNGLKNVRVITLFAEL